MVDVLKLAASGARIPMIAQALRTSEAEAVELLLAAVREAAAQALDHDGSKQVELAHLDMIRAALMPLALRGDISASRLLIRIHSARALLLGLIERVVDENDQPEAVSELDRIRARRDERRLSASS